MFEVPALCDTQVVTGAGREREGSSSGERDGWP